MQFNYNIAELETDKLISLAAQYLVGARGFQQRAAELVDQATKIAVELDSRATKAVES